MKTAKEYWKEKFDEYPQNNEQKLAVAMMQEYAQEVVKNLNIPSVIKCKGIEGEILVCCDTYIRIGATCYQNMNICIGKKCRYSQQTDC